MTEESEKMMGVRNEVRRSEALVGTYGGVLRGVI